MQKAVLQVTPNAKQGTPTLIVMRPKSLYSQMDKQDIECFLFGHGCRIDQKHFVSRESRWDKSSPPVLRFSDLSKVSAFAMFEPPALNVYLNPFATTPLDGGTLSQLEGCENVFTIGYVCGHENHPSFVPFHDSAFMRPAAARLERRQPGSLVSWGQSN